MGDGEAGKGEREREVRSIEEIVELRMRVERAGVPSRVRRYFQSELGFPVEISLTN